MVIALLASRPAEACSPAVGIGGRWVSPPDGTMAVPLNTQVRVFYQGALSLGDPAMLGDILVRPVGGAPVELTPIGGGPGGFTAVVVRPAAALDASTTYEILDRIAVPCGPGVPCEAGEYGVVGTFTTGTHMDADAPVFGGLAQATPAFDERCTSSACCGPYEAVLLQLDWMPAVDRDPPATLLYDIYADSGQAIARWVGQGAYLWFLCDGWITAGQLRSAAAQTVATGFIVRAVDLAGNEDTNAAIVPANVDCGRFLPDGGTPDAAEPDAAPPAAVGDGDGCSCRAAPAGPGAPATAFLVLLALLVRRRRK